MPKARKVTQLKFFNGFTQPGTTMMGPTVYEPAMFAICDDGTIWVKNMSKPRGPWDLVTPPPAGDDPRGDEPVPIRPPHDSGVPF